VCVCVCVCVWQVRARAHRSQSRQTAMVSALTDVIYVHVWLTSLLHHNLQLQQHWLNELELYNNADFFLWSKHDLDHLQLVEFCKGEEGRYDREVSVDTIAANTPVVRSDGSCTSYMLLVRLSFVPMLSLCVAGVRAPQLLRYSQYLFPLTSQICGSSKKKQTEMKAVRWQQQISAAQVAGYWTHL